MTSRARRAARLGMKSLLVLFLFLAVAASAMAGTVRGTGDLGIVVERASGRVVIIEHSHRSRIGAVDGLGDLSHASAVFSRDGRFAYVFGRDGGLSKIDLIEAKLVRRIVQAGNAIGGAISADGRLIAVSNYEPGGVKIFDAESLDLVADLPAESNGQRSKVVGLVETADGAFVYTLYDAGEIWIADVAEPARPAIRKFPGIGAFPYDGVTVDGGRSYVAGLFGEDGLALLDLWRPEAGVRRVLSGYGRGEEPLPVYKMPHLEGVTVAGGNVFLPAVGRHELLVADVRTWAEVARIPVHGQPVFAVARPDGRQVWVNFAHPHNDTVQVIDVPSLKVAHTLRPGKAVMHLEFTPKGDQVWISARDEDLVRIYDPRTLAELGAIAAEKPSGIFFTARATRLGY
ncbi:MAG: cytochrome D1 domain-containing protein [Defluviicoccus sp.]|nr:cytochrome D1 domain-containing protein [Defluviicoccus sp.]MDG4593522.1 cytochrome D1 domain-containing protein [Defluviicoccus sp.]MDS4012133.1 cytochrome D1 domain-containing protein [Defluviicoccus sp.]MDS4072421.1 cytochrome D1 domain-containing protein [Defluviicoccus sp.]